MKKDDLATVFENCEVYPGAVVPFTTPSSHGQKLFDEYFLPYMKEGASPHVSFAYQPKWSSLSQCVAWESLCRGSATRTHSAPGLLFPVLAKPENIMLAIAWKVREITEALAFSVWTGKPVSINFNQVEISNQIIITQLQQPAVRECIDGELLDRQGKPWTSEMVAVVHPLLRETHFDDATLENLGEAEKLLEEGFLNAIKIDITLCVQAFRIPVFFTPGDENMHFKKIKESAEDSAHIKKELVTRIGNLLNKFTTLIIVFEASIPFDVIAYAFEEFGFDRRLVERVQVQGGRFGAQAFVKKQKRGDSGSEATS